MNSHTEGADGNATVTVPTEIALNLKVANEDSSERYDASARNLVAEKPVLAYILKSTLVEYAGYSVQEIAARFIEGIPEVREIAVHQDHPDRGNASKYKPDGTMSGEDKVEGISTVEKSQRDGAIYYDIRFIAMIPQSGELVDIFVNVEIENNDTPGYPITKRGLYYGSRMLSSQRGTVFKDQEYGKIKRSVSIWICEDAADYRSDTINEYHITEECMRGDFHEAKENYDLITVVILRLGKYGEQSEDDAIRLLSKMFSMERSYEEKISALSDEFKIQVTKEISKEVLNVCNLSTGVYNKGYNSGYDSGISDGEKKGEIKKARETAYELADMGLPIEKIAKAVKFSVSEINKWIEERLATL